MNTFELVFLRGYTLQYEFIIKNCVDRAHIHLRYSISNYPVGSVNSNKKVISVIGNCA